MKKFRRKLPLIAIAMLAITALIGGTFAYFSQTSTAENFLAAKNYDSTLTETFVPPTNGLAPGVEITKQVGVTNSGQIPMLVRIKYHEYWSTDNTSWTENTTITLDDPSYNTTLTKAVYDDDSASLVWKFSGDQIDPYDDVWSFGGGEYYYYTSVLNPAAVTPKFITSIMLKDTAYSSTNLTYTIKWWDASTSAFVEGNYSSVNAVTLDEGDYIASIVTNQTTTMTNGMYYKLVFTVDTVQAIQGAADTWKPEAIDSNSLAYLFLEDAGNNIPDGAVTP
jgi:alternate signal-mediated exported protein